MKRYKRGYKNYVLETEKSRKKFWLVWIALINCNGLILTVCYKDEKFYFSLKLKIKLQ